MEKVLILYEDNGLWRYDDKEYFESVAKLRREKNVRGPLNDSSIASSISLISVIGLYTTPWKATDCPMLLVLLYGWPYSLIGYLKPFCSKDPGNIPVQKFELKVKLNNLLLAVRCQNHLLSRSPNIVAHVE